MRLEFQCHAQRIEIVIDRMMMLLMPNSIRLLGGLHER